jgi:EAL domain-containing protein (putative c-di-GMP-specific phosphodiesterase class I)
MPLRAPALQTAALALTGMTVVAEGVETAGVARELLAYGCEFAQGYYFGYPQTAAEIEAQWLEPARVTSHLSAG